MLGTSHDTAEFAVDAIVHWWCREGRRRYPQASEILILADSGGSNGARCRLWKYALQERLADRFGLAVTVCHYPTGASKWNPIEHRLFSEITKRWAGQPLTDYPTIIRLIGETKTRTGLKVHCSLSTENYPIKIKVPNAQMAQLDILKHPTLPDWNYTIFPRLTQISFCMGATWFYVVLVNSGIRSKPGACRPAGRLGSFCGCRVYRPSPGSL